MKNYFFSVALVLLSTSASATILPLKQLLSSYAGAKNVRVTGMIGNFYQVTLPGGVSAEIGLSDKGNVLSVSWGEDKLSSAQKATLSKLMAHLAGQCYGLSKAGQNKLSAFATQHFGKKDEVMPEMNVGFFVAEMQPGNVFLLQRQDDWKPLCTF